LATGIPSTVGFDGVCAIVDLNRLQIDGLAKDAMNVDEVPAALG